MKKSDLIDAEIVARIEQSEQSSYGIYDSTLVADREEAFKFYNGDKFGNEVEGRSQVVSRDVLDVVESALPQLLKVFVSGDEVVRFDPRGPEDEKAAEQETAAVNYYTMEKNDGFAVFYTWFKDALLSKNGYVKVWYEEENEVESESYKGLTDDQMTMLLKDDRVEVIEHTEYLDEIDAQQRSQALQQLQGNLDPQAQQQVQQIMAAPVKMLHDVKIEVSETRGCIKICNVAPEDILVGQDTRDVSLQEATFVQHRVLMDKDEIEEQGWEVPEGESEYDYQSRWSEQLARDLYQENLNVQQFEPRYLVKDTYMRLEGELKRFVVIGQSIVYQEEAEIVPFACITPHIMPHRHIGMSYADLTKDIQLIKSTLLRGQLDAMYLANQPRFAISDRVSLEDMLTSRPGGVVRVQGEPTTAILPLQTPAFPPTSFTLVEYLDNAKERRTGITAYNQGLDANSLNKTATGVNQIMAAAQERVLLVARTFANTGVKELFMLVHRLVRKYYTRPDIIRLRNEWVPVDPREWKERKDLSVAVGLGTGNKDQQLMHLGTLLQQQMAMMQMGLPVITPQNIYETVRQLIMNAGFKQPDQFVTNPQQVPPQPPQENPLITVKKMELQADQQKFQAETQVKMAENDKKAELEMQKFQAQAEVDRRQAEQQMLQEQARSANDITIEREKLQMQAELERYKAQLKAETDIAIAQLNAQIESNKAERESYQRELDSQRNERMHQEKIDAMTRPKTIVKDSNGRPSGIQ